MLLNKNGPGALNISADDQIKQQQSVSSATGSSLSANVSNSIVSRQITQRISYQHLLSNNILGPAESFKVEDALPFNPIETQPLQIKKLFTPGRSFPKELQKTPTRLFNDDFGTPFNLNYRKRGAKRKIFSKISHSVEKRNARERTRVHTVNQAFSILKVHLPSLRANAKRVSKLKILRTAIDYINRLKTILQNDNQNALNNTLRMALENDNTFAKNVFSSAIPPEEPKSSEDNCLRLSKPYQSNVSFLAETNHDTLASVFAANASAAENIRASTLFTQAFDANQSSALIKFPYVGYENLYMRSGANYMAYPPTATNGTENREIPGISSSIPVSYVTDPSAFYYHNVAQTNDYSVINSTTNVYF
uniref:BHLH domain-containing protein n=1 Tax=Panagrolaimus sp. PS1159 TaxID=55785 RepID=A0AC35FEQ6_9BILA